MSVGKNNQQLRQNVKDKQLMCNTFFTKSRSFLMRCWPPMFCRWPAPLAVAPNLKVKYCINQKIFAP